MTARVLLVVMASWCLASVTIGLTFCRAIIWARGLEPGTEATTAPTQAPREAPTVVALPSPRSHDVVVGLTASGDPTAVGSSQQPGRAVEA